MKVLKHLRSHLDVVKTFENPKIKLEQYTTTSEVAAYMLYTIEADFSDISGKLVADLGCGCGMLSFAASYLGAGLCIGFDIDEECLALCQENAHITKSNNVDFIKADVTKLDENWHKKFDTVIMNPPFGTKNNKGIDVQFLQTALSLSKTSVYSLHKTATRNYLRDVSKRFGVEMVVLHEVVYELPKTYKKNTQSSKDIEVDFIKYSFPKNRNKS